MMKVSNGDIRMVSELFKRHHSSIYNYYLNSTYDSALSQDLTQTAFEKLIKYKSSFKDNYQFKSWLYKVASNVKKDHYRKETAHRKRNENYFESQKEVYDPMCDSDKEDSKRLLHIALKKLPEDQREVIWLTKFKKMKYSELAEILNVTESAIKVKVHRAIKRLRVEYLQLEKL